MDVNDSDSTSDVTPQEEKTYSGVGISGTIW